MNVFTATWQSSKESHISVDKRRQALIAVRARNLSISIRLCSPRKRRVSAPSDINCSTHSCRRCSNISGAVLASDAHVSKSKGSMSTSIAGTEQTMTYIITLNPARHWQPCAPNLPAQPGFRTPLLIPVPASAPHCYRFGREAH